MEGSADGARDPGQDFEPRQAGKLVRDQRCERYGGAGLDDVPSIDTSEKAGFSRWMTMAATPSSRTSTLNHHQDLERDLLVAAAQRQEKEFVERPGASQVTAARGETSVASSGGALTSAIDRSRSFHM